MEELKWQETIPASKKYDLIVCGGGSTVRAAGIRHLPGGFS